MIIYNNSFTSDNIYYVKSKQKNPDIFINFFIIISNFAFLPPKRSYLRFKPHSSFARLNLSCPAPKIALRPFYAVAFFRQKNRRSIAAGFNESPQLLSNLIFSNFFPDSGSLFLSSLEMYVTNPKLSSVNIAFALMLN